MTNADKFRSDATRIAAREGGVQKTRAEIAARFERAAPKLGGLPKSIAAYWDSAYAEKADDSNESAAQNALDKICAMLDFLYDTDDDDNALSANDWQTLAELVDDEAERLPLDALSRLTARLVEKGAFK